MILQAQAINPAERNFYLLLACIAVLVLILYKVTGLYAFTKDKLGWYDFGEIVKANSFDSDTIPRVNVDEKGNIIGWNKGAQHLFKFTEEELADKPFVTIIPDRLKVDYADAFASYGLIKDLGLLAQTVEVPAIRKDGKEVYVKLHVAVGNMRGRNFFLCTIQDISKRVEQTNALHREINMHEYAEKLAGHGSFMWDLASGGKVHYSKNFDFVFEWAGIERGQDAYIKQIHPEDKQIILAALKQLREQKAGYDIQYRAYGKAGRLHTYHSITHCETDSNDNIIFVTGINYRLS